MKRGTLLAAGGLTIVATAALLAPMTSPYAPDAIDLPNRRAAPSIVHWFGTDELGRDVFTRTMVGARFSLTIGLCAAALTGAIGTLIGAVSGYIRGWLDQLLMRLADAMLAVPRLPLLMIAAAILNPSIPELIALVGVVGWMETARVVRAEFLSLRERPFVEAARSTGARGARMIWRHLMPNAAPAAIVATTLAVGRSILLESAMSFFGVGVQPPRASWGNMLYQAQTTMSTEPWVAIFPGVFILVTVVSVNAVGQGLAHGGSDES